MLKRYFLLLIGVVLCFAFAGHLNAQPKEDVLLYKDCSRCGMSRHGFDFTRVLIEYDDGTVIGLCSLHCASLDMATNIDKSPKSIKVGDFNGKHLIDAEQAIWVVGGTKPGVMSKRGKWAFENSTEAGDFVKTNQGQMVTFEEAVKAAYEDMYEDTKMIREKRKMKRMEHKHDAVK